eukprot:1191567-Prorocentrum_minimum.AAC.1
MRTNRRRGCGIYPAREPIAGVEVGAREIRLMYRAVGSASDWGRGVCIHGCPEFFYVSAIIPDFESGELVSLILGSSGPCEGPVRVRVGSLPLAVTRGEQYMNSSNQSTHPLTFTFDHFDFKNSKIEKAFSVRPLRNPTSSLTASRSTTCRAPPPCNLCRRMWLCDIPRTKWQPETISAVFAAAPIAYRSAQMCTKPGPGAHKP